MSRIFLFCTHLRWPVEEAGTSALEQEFLVVGDATFGELAGVLHPDKDKSTHGGYVRLFFFFRRLVLRAVCYQRTSHVMTTDTR